MPIEYKLGGRKVSSRQFFDGIAEKAIEKAENEIERRLRAICDPETGQPVRVTKSRSGGNTSWNVEGSPAAVELAKKIIEG